MKKLFRGWGFLLVWAMFAICCIGGMVWWSGVSAYTLSGYPKFMALDSNGAPLVGGKLYTYIPGSTTAKATYVDSAGAAVNTNPVILNSRGEAVIYFDGSYKLVLKDSADVTIWTLDNFQGTGVEYPAGSGSGTSGFIALAGPSGTSAFVLVPSISGASLYGTVAMANLPSTWTNPVNTSSVIATDMQGTRGQVGIYVINLTSSNSISGQTLYGTVFQNTSAASEVTATMTSSHAGVSPAMVVFQLTKAQYPISVKFFNGDKVDGLPNFNPGVDYLYIGGSGATGAFLALNGTGGTSRWFLSGSSGIAIKQF